MPVFELPGRTLHQAGLERQHRTAARLLITGIGERVERQWILLRRRHGFFHEAADYAGFVERQLDIQIRSPPGLCLSLPPRHWSFLWKVDCRAYLLFPRELDYIGLFDLLPAHRRIDQRTMKFREGLVHHLR